MDYLRSADGLELPAIGLLGLQWAVGRWLLEPPMNSEINGLPACDQGRSGPVPDRIVLSPAVGPCRFGETSRTRGARVLV